MGNITIGALPPGNWKDFECISKDVAKLLWDTDDLDNYGRGGQVQKGVDVCGYDNRNRFVGIQCKHKRIIDPNGCVSYKTSITKQDILEEIKLADSFEPKLERYIIATTSLRDVSLQDFVNEVNVKRKSEGVFTVEIWFWEYFQENFNKHTNLMYWYYENFLKESGQYNKDIHIINFIKDAFSRPAFKTSFNLENSCESFLQAIIDTQSALETGILKDRDGNIVRTCFNYRELTNKKWQDTVACICEILHQIRECYTKSLAEKKVMQNINYIEIYDPEVKNKLNLLRAKVLKSLNGILSEANISNIMSSLLLD